MYSLASPPLKEMLHLLLFVHDGAKEILQTMRVNLGSATERTILSLYATIIEQTDCSATLLKQDKAWATDIMLRSSLEAFVDLINLANDREYLNAMIFSYHDEQIKLLREGMTGGNKFFGDLHMSPDTQEALKEHQADRDALAAKGFKKMLVAERFAQADLTAEYKSIYKSLCDESHNNIGVLMKRHIEQEGDEVNVAVFKPRRAEDLAFSIDSLTSLLIDSSYIVHDYFGSPKVDVISNWKERRVAIAKAFEGRPCKEMHPHLCQAGEG